MPIIDVQVHAYDRDHPGRPWINRITGPDHVTGDEMVAAMDAVNVDGAILVSSYTVYGYDPSYAVECYAKHPGKFGLVSPIDPRDPASAEIIADWAATEGAVGIRVVMSRAATKDADDPGLNRAFAAAAKYGLPVNVLVWGRLDQTNGIIERHPDTLIVIDHLGLRQTDPPAEKPWEDLPSILAMARHDHVRMKISGACTLSHQPYPYGDIWDPVMTLIDSFGVDRCMWGTDWTRAVSLTYEQGVQAFLTTPRLSDSDRAALMGGTVEKVYGWSPS
jgi:predicted TIM-barrel fold metal-dependent hydrolase